MEAEENHRCIYKAYLDDLAVIIKDLSLEAKQDLDRSDADSIRQAQNFGRVLAYATVISMMQNQAYAFEIDLKDINLQGVDPDVDLLGARS